ncbi:hypothetical protein ES332_D07G074400v1 [Gossypium tomentosum]|uniref:Pentacotripeptide-repeat region of PRORP domain-containing protein n=1 Tax=Gossypium tomentosum TaxID=34277 RepID=A0A5D2K4Q3_GOSTO|nr:hypothetical protein ES332_D07G074400v1 [Gossypium tomentosum]
MMVLREKSYHLQPDILVKLALSLSRAQMPIPSSTILRLMLEKGMLPPMNVLQLLFLHMVKTEVGACIASNLLIQICDNYVQFCSGKSPCANLLKPDTVIFNLVLDACVRFGSSLKGQQIIELMSQTEVVADGHSIIIIAQIHEINGQRDELKKFKDHVAPLPVAFVSHYRQFYECLLSLHFKFDDIDAAAELLLDMNRSRGSHPMDDPGKDFQKPRFVPIGSQNLRNGLKIQIMPELIHKDSALKEEGRSPLSIKEASSIYQPSLSKCLVEEVSDAEKAVSHIIYELNSSIYFFSKAKMMGDALNIYRRMQEMKVQPTEHTFMYLVCGYSSLEMYRDITILWGDMKRIMETGSLTLSSDLYEFLLLNFLRGGYFERVMEAIGYMNKCNMYVDKWMYKSEYLKIHKNLYRSLKASKARTEAQGKRLEHVKAFKKWAGIN